MNKKILLIGLVLLLMVASATLPVAFALNETTDAHGLNNIRSGDRTMAHGIKITATYDVTLSYVTLVSGTDTTKAYLYENNAGSLGTLLETVDIISDVATFSDISLTEGESYFILADADGSTYTRDYTETFTPITKTNIDYITGWDGNTAAEFNRIYMFKSVTTDNSPAPPEPESDEVIRQVIEFDQTVPVTITSATFQDVYASTFELVNESLAYTTWVVELEALNKDMVGTCRAVIDDIDYNTSLDRTITNGDAAIIYLSSTVINLTADVEHTVKLQCHRNSNPGAQLSVSNGEGFINIMTTLAGEKINYENAKMDFTLNSTSYVKLLETNFTTSNLTGTDLELSLISDGSIQFDYDSDSLISLYAVLDGEQTAIFDRDGAAGTEGSGAGLYITKNVTPNANITFEIWGKSSSGDGSVTIVTNLAENFAHISEAQIANLTGLTSSTGTWTTIQTLYVNNSNHATADIIAKAAFSASNAAGTNTLFYRIKSGTSISQEYSKTITTGRGTGMLQHVIPNPGLTNTSVEFQVYSDAGSSDFDSGAMMAYIAQQISATPQFYIVNARDDWDNTSIIDFNVTLDTGTKYISNSSGNVTIYHVNGLDTFTTDADDYFSKITADHNTTTDITVGLYQSDITFNATEIITNNTVLGNITIDGRTKLTNESFFLSAGTYNATFSGENHFDKTVFFNVTALDIKTIDITGLSGTALNMTFRDARTNETRTGITGYFSNLELNFNETFNTGGNFYTELSLLQGYSYNVTVNDNDYALWTNEYFVNASVVDETFYLYTINSISITIKNEITRELINDTTFALEFVGSTNAFNASTSNGTYYIDLITPDSYQLRYYSTSSTDYALRSYTFDLVNQSFNEIVLYAIPSNASLVTTTFNVFSTALEPVEGARVILERYYIAENGFSQVSSGSTNVDGVYIDFVEAVNAFYRYKIVYQGEVKYESPSQGTQFSADTNLNIYIELFADNYEEYTDIYSIPTTITYTALTNYTGYFDFSYTNPNLYQLCFEVYINNSNSTETCPTVSTSGSVQIPVGVAENSRSVAIATAKAYSSNVASYVDYKSETQTFYPSSDFTQDYNDLFNLGLSIILTLVALVFIRFPAVNVFLQTFILILFAFIPLPFYTISMVTIGWIVAFNLVILWITKKEGVPQ